VATAIYIKAESLRHQLKFDAAGEAYRELIDNYSFGQCWDPRGWFWKPAVVAREKLAMLNSGKFYDFGDYSSMSLLVAAWKALDEEDIEAIIAFTDKAIELYGAEADKMQASLSALPTGEPEAIHAYYALNDVATAYFIKGEAYFKNDMLNEARSAYQKVIDKYPFAQCWDPRGWFWTVADGSREKIEMIDSGLFMDFWDYSSKDLVRKAWESLGNLDYPRAIGYANKCIQIYEQQAKKQSEGLRGFPGGSNIQKHSFWALNDVATAHYIKAETYLKMQDKPRAIKEFETAATNYPYAQCWDPHGWWWHPAQKAKEKLEQLRREAIN
jgi:tetratricopeptide (TPR) repeat protein